MLTARARHHPDFVPAFDHLPHIAAAPAMSLSTMHPCWAERDRELAGAYLQASIEF